MVERPLYDREVAGSIPGRVIPKTLKVVLAACQKSRARTGQLSVNIMWLGRMTCQNVWGVIFQWGSTLKVSIELPAKSRHVAIWLKDCWKRRSAQIKQTNKLYMTITTAARFVNQCSQEGLLTFEFKRLVLLVKNQQTTCWNSFLIFLRKQVLTFHAKCLYWKQFAWNVKSCFSRKMRKLS